MHEKHKPAIAIFAGTGNQLQRVQALAQQLNVEKYAHFVGRTRKIPELLHYTDALVLTSKRGEGMPIVLLEASTMKKPLVGPTNIGAEDLILDGENGLLYENDNPAALADKLAELVDAKPNATFGAAAFAHVRKNFSTDANMQRLMKLYSDTLCNAKQQTA